MYRDAKAVCSTRESTLKQEGVHKVETQIQGEGKREYFRCGYNGIWQITVFIMTQNVICGK